MKFTVGFSPCPNDTFIFDALVHHKIDTEGLEFEVHLADVEELNNRAFKVELDITKVSYHAYLFLTEFYRLLDAGSALGFGAGPLLISISKKSRQDIIAGKTALPGKYTTANLLYSLAYPESNHKEFMLFSDIEQSVLERQCDAGVIIHENRFTFLDKGLHQLADLGEFWESLTHLPIPLGGIVIKKDVPAEIACKVNSLLRKSIEYAYAHMPELPDFVTCNAQEMSPEVMMKHIGLYVNEYSLSLGKTGRAAVRKLFEMAAAQGLISNIPTDFFA